MANFLDYDAYDLERGGQAEVAAVGRSGGLGEAAASSEARLHHALVVLLLVVACVVKGAMWRPAAIFALFF
ncbi:hypothetical protein OsJ_20849 [Oryza sativa Japonica Group]|nr:hypothetical protein OsJ_20849 [Oryza sativa Japonica Group]